MANLLETFTSLTRSHPAMTNFGKYPLIAREYLWEPNADGKFLSTFSGSWKACLEKQEVGEYFTDYLSSKQLDSDLDTLSSTYEKLQRGTWIFIKRIPAHAVIFPSPGDTTKLNVLEQIFLNLQEETDTFKDLESFKRWLQADIEGRQLMRGALGRACKPVAQLYNERIEEQYQEFLRENEEARRKVLVAVRELQSKNKQTSQETFMSTASQSAQDTLPWMSVLSDAERTKAFSDYLYTMGLFPNVEILAQTQRALQGINSQAILGINENAYVFPPVGRDNKAKILAQLQISFNRAWNRFIPTVTPPDFRTWLAQLKNDFSSKMRGSNLLRETCEPVAKLYGERVEAHYQAFLTTQAAQSAQRFTQPARVTPPPADLPYQLFSHSAILILNGKWDWLAAWIGNDMPVPGYSSEVQNDTGIFLEMTDANTPYISVDLDTLIRNPPWYQFLSNYLAEEAKTWISNNIESIHAHNLYVWQNAADGIPIDYVLPDQGMPIFSNIFLPGAEPDIAFHILKGVLDTSYSFTKNGDSIEINDDHRATLKDYMATLNA